MPTHRDSLGIATRSAPGRTNAACFGAEVGRRVAGHIRVAFEVDDSAAVTSRLAGAGATVLAPPTHTPWQSLISRLDAPAGLQLTLFQALDGPEFAESER